MNKRLYYTSLAADSPHQEKLKLRDLIWNSSIDINCISFLDRGHEDPECRQRLINFLGDKRIFWKRIEDDWVDICSINKPDKMVFNDDLINKLNRNSVFQLRAKTCHFNFAEGIYLNLQEQYTLSPDGFIDKDYFDYFFAYRLSRRDLNQVQAFLAFNFEFAFNKDFDRFTQFLSDVVLEKYADLIGPKIVKFIHKKFGLESNSESGNDSIGLITPTVVAYMILFIDKTSQDINKKELYELMQKKFKPNDDAWSAVLKTTYNRLINRKDLPFRKHKRQIELAVSLLREDNYRACLEGQKVLKLLQ